MVEGMQDVADAVGSVAPGVSNLGHSLTLSTSQENLVALEHKGFFRAQSGGELLAFFGSQGANEYRWFHHHHYNTITLSVMH